MGKSRCRSLGKVSVKLSQGDRSYHIPHVRIVVHAPSYHTQNGTEKGDGAGDHWRLLAVLIEVQKCPKEDVGGRDASQDQHGR